MKTAASHCKSIANFIIRFRFEFLLGTILLVVLGLRLFVLSYPLMDNTEAGRDYWVGRHIALYKEFPLVGPWNDVLGGYFNSPIYYYFIGLLVAIRDDFLFLSIVNILLQLSTAVIIYMLGKKLFSPHAGLIAVILFLFSWEAWFQSKVIWQPHVMQPLINLSFLLFLLSYEKKKYWILLSSIIAFSLAVVMHNSAGALALVYAPLVWFVLKRQKGSYGDYAVATGTGFLVLSLSYLPVIIFAKNNNLSLFNFHSGRDPFSMTSWHQNFMDNIFEMLKVFFINIRKEFFSLEMILLLCLAMLLILYSVRLKSQSRRQKTFLLILLVVLQPLFLSSLVNLQIARHHFMPILGIGAILIAELCCVLIEKNRFSYIISGIFIFFLVKASSANFFLFYDRSSSNIANEAIIALEMSLPKRRNFASALYGFDIKLYNPIVLNPYEEFFWALLEKRTDVKFTSFHDNSLPTLKVDNQGRDVFLICQGMAKETCLNRFSQEEPHHTMMKEIFTREPYHIYPTSLKQ